MSCYVKVEKDGSRLFLCGKLGKHCANCGWVSSFLCDYPVGNGKTCDRPLCESHAHEVAPDVHYCPGHFEQWKKFESNGGVKRALENVVPFQQSFQFT
jgi:hypothetical protein